jgi:hypothetical protein
METIASHEVAQIRNRNTDASLEVNTTLHGICLKERLRSDEPALILESRTSNEATYVTKNQSCIEPKVKTIKSTIQKVFYCRYVIEVAREIYKSRLL